MSNCGLVVNKNDINTYFQSFIKPRIFDAEWHISLASDFLNIIDKDEFKLDDLCNPKYIKDVLNDNKDNENDKKAQMITRDCDPIHEYGQFVAGVCVGVAIMAVMSFILSL